MVRKYFSKTFARGSRFYLYNPKALAEYVVKLKRGIKKERM